MNTTEWEVQLGQARVSIFLSLGFHEKREDAKGDSVRRRHDNDESKTNKVSEKAMH
jgi:hypothetical protein